MKLVCYIKWAEGRSWCSSKIFNSHINVNYKKTKLVKRDDDNGALPVAI